MEIYKCKDARIKNLKIIIVGYNRPRHLELAIEALKNELSRYQYKIKVEIHLDGDKHNIPSNNEADALKIAKDSGFKVIKQISNYGLRANILKILSGLQKQEEEYFLFIEDDVLLKKNSLDYFLQQLQRFEKDQSIFQISGFTPLFKFLPKDGLFAHPRISTWGWAGWRDKISEIDFDEFTENFSVTADQEFIINKYMPDISKKIQQQKQESINAWSLDVQLYMLNRNLLTIYPLRPFVKNIGMDGSGINNTGFKFNFFFLPKINLQPGTSYEFISTTDDIISDFKRYYTNSFLFKLIKIFFN